MTGLRRVAHDLRIAARSLSRRPTYALVATVTLALGVGANIAIFSLLNAHFFTPLPYEDPENLVLIWESARNDPEQVTTVAPGNYFAWREQARSLADIAPYNVSRTTLSGEGVPERVTASVVGPGFFDVLGVRPALGSGFSEEAIRDDPLLVVLSHGLWSRRYGGDPGIVGRAVRINGRPHTVVGVMPEGFRQPERSLDWQRAELWRPLVLDDQRDDFGSRYLRTVARLGPGVDLETARTEMAALSGRLQEAHPRANAGRVALVRSMDDYLLGDARPVLFMLLAAGAAVLLIVCANVANLTLARGEERRREFAVRASLGSGRGRLLWQLTAEGLVLALAGGALGAAVVAVARPLLQTVQARFFTGLVDVQMDANVLVFTVVVATLCGITFGLPTARAVATTDLREALGSTRSATARSPVRNLLIVGQVALATTLLIVAVLLVRSFDRLINVDTGFEARDALTFEISASSARYDSLADIEQFLRDTWTALEEVPGIESLTMVSEVPFTTENWSMSVRVEGQTYEPGQVPGAEYHIVLPNYFEVMGMDLVRGSLPTDFWSPDESDVVINERMAREFFPGQDPIGRHLLLGGDQIRVRVSAIVEDALDDGFDATAEATLFVPWGTRPIRGMAVIAATRGNAGDHAAAVRSAVASVDPDVPAAGLVTLSDLMDATVRRPRAAFLIGLTFAALAVAVAAAGIYGVLSYSVQSRTREIGIRGALGAPRRTLMRMVLGHSTRLVVVGLLLGTLGALAAGSFLSGLLFGVERWDPVSLLASVAVLGTVGHLAALIPARRAVRIDPREALRTE